MHQIAERDRFFINEIFCAPQGEGGRAGEMSVFVRFTGCNMKCRMEEGLLSPGGFDCDTEFESGVEYTLNGLIEEIAATRGRANWVVLTGGEPALQVTAQLVDQIHGLEMEVAIETNGSTEVPDNIDWITVSPKVAEHAIRQITANEVKYVRHKGQGIPHSRVMAPLRYISPAYGPDGKPEPGALETCLKLIEEFPQWRLSEQQHKRWGVR